MAVDIRTLTEPSAVVRLCEQAAASMRAVSDLTTPDACDIESPSDACRAVAALRLVAERLPSALVHVAIWLCEQVDMDAVVIDVDAPDGSDPRLAAKQLRSALIQDAIPLLDDLADALDRGRYRPRVRVFQAPDPVIKGRSEMKTTHHVGDAARHLYDAEMALHDARQSHCDRWIVAAADRLHEAVVEYLSALAEESAPADGSGS